MTKMLNFNKDYVHSLVDRLFDIREAAQDGWLSDEEELGRLSNQAISIVSEIMWEQAHWAFRYKMGVPRQKIRTQTPDEQRLSLMHFLNCFVVT